MEQRDIVKERPQVLRGDRLAAKHDHERPPAVRMDVGRARAEVLDEWVDFGAHGESVQKR
jgi:hypothetical protein